MNTLIELFSSSWAQALGWTLLHSIWQSLVCVITVITLLRFVPTRFSERRYAIATVGLGVIFLASCGTFLYLNSGAGTQSGTQLIPLQHAGSEQQVQQDVTSLTSLIAYARVLIQSNIPFIVILWGVGTILFSLRLFGGWWYTRSLRNNAFLVEGDLSKNLQRLAAGLNIRRFVALAESSVIQAPIVIGFLKPMVLMPVGMCAGLSTDQLESILIHELVHIRRGDYCMNVIQSVLEALFFFNPFVWIISGVMRREREHCCDDAVVMLHGNPLAYARALATLEEVRLSKSGLALSLAENKNQLLNRIKRIMEKSVQHYSGRERMVPLVLLVVGLICASWLTIQADNRDLSSELERQNEQLALSDTTIRDKSSSYHGREVRTVEKEGEPDVEVIEEVEGDFDQDAFSMHFNINIPDAPDAPGFTFNFSTPDVPDISEMHIEVPEPPEFEMMMHTDTFPNEVEWHGGHDWEAFSKAFEENFKSQFGEFYEKHGEELKKMMERVDAQVNGHENMSGDLIAKIEALGAQQEKLARVHMSQMNHDKAFVERQEIQARKAEEMAKRFEEINAVELKKVEANMKKIEEKMKAIQKRHKEIEKSVREELVKDGYLGKDEELNNLEISNEYIEVNGKKIKSSDEKKYRKLVKEFENPMEPE